MEFPSELTKEELMLKKKYEVLREKKKDLEEFEASKQEPPPPNPIVKPNSSAPKTDAREIKIKITVKDPKPYTSGVYYYSSKYYPSGKSSFINENDQSASVSTDAIPSTSGAIPKAPVTKVYETYARNVNDKLFETCARNEKDQNRADYSVRIGLRRNYSPERPGQGNIVQFRGLGPENKFLGEVVLRSRSVYVQGLGVTQEILKNVFGSIGRIINILMEVDKKSGFVTFEKFEDADRAIGEVNGLVYADVLLNVSKARYLPFIFAKGEVHDFTWATLAVRDGQFIVIDHKVEI